LPRLFFSKRVATAAHTKTTRTVIKPQALFHTTSRTHITKMSKSRSKAANASTSVVSVASDADIADVDESTAPVIVKRKGLNAAAPAAAAATSTSTDKKRARASTSSVRSAKAEKKKPSKTSKAAAAQQDDVETEPEAELETEAEPEAEAELEEPAPKKRKSRTPSAASTTASTTTTKTRKPRANASTASTASVGGTAKTKTKTKTAVDVDEGASSKSKSKTKSNSKSKTKAKAAADDADGDVEAAVTSIEEFAATWQPWGAKGRATPEAWREWCEVLKAMSELPLAVWQRCKRAADKATRKKRNGPKRERDVLATMQAHAARIEATLSDAEFAQLDGKWLADVLFDGAVPAAELGTSGDLEALAARVTAQQAPAATVYAVAVAKGFKPLGIVSCRKNDEVGKQLADAAVRVNRKLPMRHMEQSPFGEIAADVKYLPAPVAAAVGADDVDADADDVDAGDADADADADDVDADA
jgi:hypothetical protein